MKDIDKLFSNWKCFLICAKSGDELYAQILYWHKQKPKRFFKREFVELVYATLVSWGMNARKAKLQKFPYFYKQIKNNQKLISQLRGVRIETASDKDISRVGILFDKLNLTKTSTKIVTISKTLHFFLPWFVPPMDRENTLKRLFYSGYNPANERECFESILKWHVKLCNKFSLKSKTITKYFRGPPAYTIPKLIDNAIMGYKGQ